MRIISFAALAVLSIGVAGYALVVYGLTPLGAFVHPDMRSVFEANRLGIYAHVFASLIALALGPFQFHSGLRKRRISLHRWMGRVYLGIGVLIGGLAGLYMALHAFGGLAARLGFAGLAFAWLYTGLQAYLAIRGGQVALHRRWMVRNFALTFAAVTLRLYLPASAIAGIEFETAYPYIAWLCWVPNFVVVEIWFNRTRVRPATGTGKGRPAVSDQVQP
ncbi:MAG TPA: DUF2306 domain-containing protein [Woeseiaceae bacterium]|nr:DUF2306 domain-containing protein [Woeseiaceae bacterium]